MDKTPEEFINDMRRALERGDFNTAHQLSVEAAQHYPEHEDIKKCAYILAPPKVTVTPSDPEKRKRRQANREWIAKNLDRYRHRWIALRNGELVADGASADELYDQLEDAKGLYITVLH